MTEMVEVLVSAGGSTAHMYNTRDDRSTGLTINKMETGIFVSLATLQFVWERNIPYSVFPLGNITFIFHFEFYIQDLNKFPFATVMLDLKQTPNRKDRHFHNNLFLMFQVNGWR